MRIAVLSDNRRQSPEYITEHGLCIYLETDHHKILLDVGASENFILNARKLNINLQEVDYVFISHGHSDHIGGLTNFLDLNTKAKIILSSVIQYQTYYSENGKLHSISTNIDYNEYRERILFVENKISISDDIMIYNNQSTKYPTPLGNRNLFKKEINGSYISDYFNHELIFTIGKKELFVYTGCAHNGLLNILETVKKNSSNPISHVLGGFHLLSPKIGCIYESDDEIKAIGNTLYSDYPSTIFYTGHCTSDNAFNLLSDILCNQLVQFYCGYTKQLS